MSLIDDDVFTRSIISPTGEEAEDHKKTKKRKKVEEVGYLDDVHVFNSRLKFWLQASSTAAAKLRKMVGKTKK